MLYRLVFIIMNSAGPEGVGGVQGFRKLPPPFLFLGEGIVVNKVYHCLITGPFFFLFVYVKLVCINN